MQAKYSGLDIAPSRQAPPEPLSVDQTEMLQFIYLMPVGVMKFAADGEVQLLNPMTSQLLVPLLPEPSLTNIFTALRHLCPELRRKVDSFPEPAGTILDQRRIDTQLGATSLSLSLSVIRITPDVHMAVIRDITRLAEMLNFAFAAADILVDVDPYGTIAWAGGATQSLLGLTPAEAIGRPLASLFRARDRENLSRAILGIGNGLRLPPTLLHLANHAETPRILSGLAPAGVHERCFIAIGPPISTSAADRDPLKPAQDFTREVESWLRSGATDGSTGALALLDVQGWDAATRNLNPRQMSSLRREFGRMARDTNGEPLVVGEIATGRFGILGPADTDFGRLGAALQDLLASFGTGPAPVIAERRLDLTAPALSLTQSVQALRLVLGRFGSTGDAGLAEAGLAEGLVGILEHAGQQKRALATIINDGRFDLAYQPIVRLADRSLHHYEALLRPHPGPDNPAGTPGEFVTLVEATGLAQDLDLAVLRRASLQLRSSEARIAVNVSGLSIIDSAFGERMDRIIAGLPKGHLLVEVTETAEISDIALAGHRITQLHQAGIPVCLDDFGAGSASMRYLRELAVDFVKLDGSYVRTAVKDPQSRSFVAAMREMATASGAESIAEMIETEEDAALMRELGVTFGQGWLFGRPAPLPATAPKPVAAKPKIATWKY